MCPDANFDKDLNLPKGSSLYIKLSSKGDKIKFRIAKTPTYETKHWLDKKTTVLCAKYNSDLPVEECKYCDQYQEAVSAQDKEKAKQIKPVTTFHYPIVNLADNLPAIFEFTAKSIHYTIRGYAVEGVDVMGCDWSVERTEERGNYYKVLRLGDAPLTDEQKVAMENAKKLMLNGNKSSSVTDENAVANSHVEDVEPDEIPF